MNKKLSKTIIRTVILLAIGFTIFQITSRIFHNQLDFDEAYNLQIALNLKNSLQYKTFDRLFDVNITTGPTVLVPAAFLYNQSEPLAPRIVVAAYSLLLLAVVLTRYFSRSLERIMYLALINITPLFFLFSTQIFGELPGFLFLLLSYMAATRSKYLASGILFGLSVLTKNVYILGIIPILMYAVYPKRDRRWTWRQCLYFVGGTAGVIGLWTLYILSHFGFNIGHYVSYINSIKSFTQETGSIKLSAIEKRFAMINYTINLDGAFFVFLALFMSAYTFMRSKIKEAQLLSAFTICYLIYFICFGATNFYRHLFPSLLSLTLTAPLFISSFFSSLNFERKLFTLAVLTVLVISVLNYKYRDSNEFFMKKTTEQSLLFLDQTNKPYLRSKKILLDQYAMANFIKQNIDTKDKIAGFAWLNSPEIAYLTARKIYRTPESNDIPYILVSVYDRLLDPNGIKKLENYTLETVYENDSYTLYKKSDRTLTLIYYRYVI